MLEVFSEIEQGTDAWRKIRSGIITASNFATVLAKGRSGGDSKTRQTLLYRLAGEIITGEPAESYSNGYMERGHRVENEARQFYAFLHDIEPEQIGFIRNGRKGCSPDSLLGKDGMLEVKSHAPHILIDLLFKDEFPPEHKAQTQGQLWVGEREWVDIICYFPSMPPLIKRAGRDEKYIASLSDAVDQFNDELAAIVEKVTAYGSEARNAA